MANYNLTSQKIKDTYEQLVQVSGSALVDGTGSLVDTLDYVTNPTFTAYTSSTATSTSASVADLQTQINALEAGSGSADWDLITGKPAGLVSGSAQLASDISGSFTSTSASLAADIATNKANIATNVSDISTNTGNISTNTGNISTNTTNIATQTSRVDSLVSATSSYAVKNSDNVFTGTQTFDNITVNGTGSFAYIQSVTGSAKIIGDAFIQLNTDTPSQRYAGLQVIDSGSTADTASLIWDSQTNDWFYEYEGDDPTDHGVLLFGPEYGTKGSPTYLTNNTIPKGDGGHHLNDSNIVDDGTSVTVSTSLTASAFQGDLDGTATSASFAITASYALNAAGGGGLETGNSGTDSIKTAASLTTTAAVANGPQSIAIGNAAKVSGTASLHISLDDSNTFAAGDQTINIGKDINNTGGYSMAIGHNLTNTGTGGNVLIGRSVTTAGDYSIGIGEGAQAQQGGAVAIGQSARSSGNSVAIGSGAIMGNSYGFAGGYNARANNDASIAIGGDVNVSSNQAIAIGVDTTIDGSSQGAVALGQDADISNSPKAVTLGQGVKATGAAGGIAIGSGSSVTAAAEINIGNRFKYDGTSTITLDASLIKVADSASATGSLIDNVHPAIASGSTAIQHIVTIDQTAYTTLSDSGNVYDDTLYIISNASADTVIDGNLQVDGQIFSPMFAGTIASSTSSIDFDNGNFATLNCASSTFLANPTNLQGGTTYTLVVTNGANISGYGTAWKFAGGTEPTLSANTDVITAVCDGTSLYAAALADFS